MPGLDNRQQPDHAQAESLVVDDCAGGGHCWVRGWSAEWAAEGGERETGWWWSERERMGVLNKGLMMGAMFTLGSTC